MEDGGSIPEEGDSGKERSRRSYSSTFRGRSVPTQLPAGRAPPSLRRRANLPGSGGARPQHATLRSLLCRGRPGPFCAHPRPAPSPLHSRPPFPETPGLPTSSLTPVPLALRFGLPSHLSVDGGAENGFSDGICVQEHRGAKDGVWKRRGCQVRKWP